MRLTGLMIAAVLAAPNAHAEEAVERFAVIVANNASVDGTLTPLRYADDDGARFAELLTLTSSRTSLLSVLDSDTQRVFPDLAARARPPSRASLLQTLQETFEAIRAANARGARTILYFVYVGHGSIGDSGEGYMHLLDGRFTRSDLFQEVVSRSPARINHVVIDACNAYLMVARRGDGGTAQLDAALDDFVDREDLSRYPGTGVMVSTSKATEVHEWSRYESGVFSHELRSAMAGAADVDGDGGVTYAEARAFVSAANARVSDPKAKLEIFAQPPAIHLDEPLFEAVRAPGVATLLIPARLADRYFLQDARGVRYADLHMSGDAAVTVALVPSPTYFLRAGDQEMRIDLSLVRHADASALVRQPAELAERGSEALEFQKSLFAVPFGRAYFEGYRASWDTESATRVAITPEPSGTGPMRIAAWASAGGSVAAFAAALGVGLSAQSKAREYERAIGSTDDLEAIRQSGEARARTANVLVGVAVGLAATSAGLWLFSGE